jgi:Cof subfamily protein (haloacid dehalogenase superfamily)
MDHTLLDSHSVVSRENLDAIAEFTASGGLFTVASGRSPRAIEIYPELVRQINAPAITSNGGILWDFGTERCKMKRTLPDGLTPVLTSLLARFPELGLAAYAGVDGFFQFRSNDEIEDLIRRERRPAQATFPQMMPHELSKFLIAGRHNVLLEAETFLKPLLNGRADTVFSEDIFLEIMPKGVSKGAALCVLMEQLSLTPGQVVALGDGMNDLELLRTAGTGVAVANAVPTLRAAADAVVGSNDEHAAAQCIRKFCL